LKQTKLQSGEKITVTIEMQNEQKLIVILFFSFECYFVVLMKYDWAIKILNNFSFTAAQKRERNNFATDERGGVYELKTKKNKTTFECDLGK
jgi:hypothetical protein